MPKYHKVAPGECIATIALQYGFNDYTTIWNDPKNQALQQKRKNPNVLAPDDILFIPDKANKNESRGSGQQHSFQIKKPTIRFRLMLKDGSEKPFANTAYTLKLADSVLTGSTDGDGLLEQNIPIGTDSGDLSLTEPPVTWTLQFGHLNPPETISGLMARLQNLGYDPGPSDSPDAAKMKNALQTFQQENGLPVTGQTNAQTQAKLLEKHGC